MENQIFLKVGMVERKKFKRQKYFEEVYSLSLYNLQAPQRFL